MSYAVKDTSLKQTKALPNGAATVYTDPIDLELTSRADLVNGIEFLISAPALVVGDLANGKTMKYDVQTDDNSGFSSATTLIAAAITQTGAGGAGAAAATYRFRLPSNAERYVRIAATNDDAGDASDKSMTFEALL